jgi:hypothetical protein
MTELRSGNRTTAGSRPVLWLTALDNELTHRIGWVNASVSPFALPRSIIRRGRKPLRSRRLRTREVTDDDKKTTK